MRPSKLLIVLALAPVLGWSCQAPENPTEETAAATPNLIPRSTLFGNADRFQGRISPDGSNLSWLAPRDGVQNIWVAPADNPEDARPITSLDLPKSWLSLSRKACHRQLRKRRAIAPAAGRHEIRM